MTTPGDVAQISCPAENCHAVFESADFQPTPTNEPDTEILAATCGTCGNLAAQCLTCGNTMEVSSGEECCGVHYEETFDRDRVPTGEITLTRT